MNAIKFLEVVMVVLGAVITVIKILSEGGRVSQPV
jgi:hypothetical protein